MPRRLPHPLVAFLTSMAVIIAGSVGVAAVLPGASAPAAAPPGVLNEANGLTGDAKAETAPEPDPATAPKTGAEADPKSPDQTPAEEPAGETAVVTPVSGPGTTPNTSTPTTSTPTTSTPNTAAPTAEVTVTSIAVNPATIAVSLGSTKQLKVVATKSDGTKTDVTPDATFRSSNVAIATITAAGVIKPAKVGTANVSALYNGLESALAPAVVAEARLDSITVTAAGADLGVGDTAQLTATGQYADGTTKIITGQATWGSTRPAIAAVDQTGLVTALSPGTARIVATFGGVASEGTTINVDGSRPTSLQIAPAAASVAKGGTEHFTVTALYPDGTNQDVTNQATWSSTDATVATIVSSGSARGLATAMKAGTTTIRATFATRTASTSLTVNAAALTGVTVAPAAPSVAKGATVQLTAVAVYSDGTTVDVSATAAWQTDNTNTTVSTTGLVTGAVQGNSTITAAYGGKLGTATVTVTAPPLTGIQLTPPTADLTAGATQQLAVTANYSDATTADVTAQATYTSSSTATATVDATGLVRGVRAGTATITATWSGRTATTAVTVTAATVTAVRLSPGSAQTLAPNATLAMTATATLSDSTSNDVSTQAAWRSSDPTVATIDATGRVTGVKAGSTSITATYQGQTSAAVVVTVQGTRLASLAVSPTSDSVAAGGTKTFTAVGTYSDGTTATLTTAVSWTSSAADVASVAATGVATGLKAGTATVRATLDGQTGTAVLTVTSATLDRISIDPHDTTTIVGNTLSYVATAVYSDTSQVNVSTQATWTSSNPAVATVDAVGRVTTVAGGTAVIRAAFGGKTSYGYTLTVKTSAITALTIGGGGDRIATATTRQLTVRATLADGSTATLDPSFVTWSSSAPAVATISASGLVNTLTVGQTTITARSGQITATASIGVANPTSISLSPSSVSLLAGETQRITVWAWYGGSGVSVTPDTWVVGDPSVATVAGSGTVTALKAGTTTITANVRGFSAVLQVTVLERRLSAITVTGTQTLPDGATTQLTATGSYSNGTSADISAAVTWASATPTVARVSAAGVVTAVDAGTTVVTASQGSITAAGFTVTVNVRPVQSLQVTPSGAKVDLGKSQAYTATATYADGTTADVSAGATWASSDTTRATITNRGVLTGVKAGAVNVTATYRSKSATVPATVGVTGLDRMQTALATGNPDLVTQAELLAEVPKSLDRRVSIADAIIPAGTVVNLRTSDDASYVTSPGSLQPLLRSTGNYTGSSTTTGRTLAAVGTSTSSRTPLAYFAGNPFVNAADSSQVQPDAGMTTVTRRTVQWLLGADSAAAVTQNIVVANVRSNQDTATRSFLTTAFPNAVINGGGGVNACDFAPTSPCTTSAGLIVVADGNNSGSNDADVRRAILAAYTTGTPLLMFMNSYAFQGSLIWGLADELGFGQELTYWDRPGINASPKSEQVPTPITTDQFRTDALSIAGALGPNPLTTADYASCITANGGTLSGEDIATCVNTPPAGASAAAKAYFAALARTKSIIGSLNTAGTSVFADSTSDQNETLRVLALLADKVRTGKTAGARADETATAIDYPVNTRTDATAVGRALFADWFTPTAWSGNGAAKDLGTLYCASVEKVADGSCPQAQFPDVGDHRLALQSTALDQWSATGLTLVPGRPTTVSVTNNVTIPVYVSTFEPYLDGDGRTAEYTPDGVSRYTRPQFPGTDWIRVRPGTPVTMSSPYGGPLYVRMASNATAGVVEVDLDIDGASTHPAVLDANSSAQIAAFTDQVKTTTAYYVDLVGTGFQVHTTVGKIKESIDPAGQSNSGRRIYYDEAHGGVSKLLVDYRDNWFNRQYKQAGLKVSGETLDESLSPAVRSACASFGWPCTDETINQRNTIQHITYDVYASCGAGCSGNPITSQGDPDPIGTLEGHELGHNLQRTALNVHWADTGNGSNLAAADKWSSYVNRSGEVSNNLFPYWNQWTYHRLTVPARDGTADTGRLDASNPGSNADAFALAQSAYANLTSDGQKIAYTRTCAIKGTYPASTPAKVVVANSTWSDGTSYADGDLRLAFYTQLPVILDETTLANGTKLSDGRDIYTLLYGAARAFSTWADTQALWEANRAALGLGLYDFTNDAVYGSGKNVSTMIGNDFLLIELAKITGYDLRPYFDAHGVFYTDLAGRQLAANAPTGGWKNLGKATVVLGNQLPKADLAGTTKIDITDPATLWPGTDDNADGTVENLIGFNPAQCAVRPTALGVSGTSTATVGLTRQATATGTYSDGSTKNLTSTVTWSSSNTAVATVDSTGKVTAVSTGYADITATLTTPQRTFTNPTWRFIVSAAPVAAPSWPAVAAPETSVPYTLTNVGSNLRAAGPAGSSTSRDLLVQRAGEDDLARLALDPFGSSFKLRIVGSGLCFDIKSDSTADGAQVQQYSCSGNGSNLIWTPLQNPAGGVSMVNALSNKCLAVVGGSTTTGANLELRPCDSPAAMRWNLTPVVTPVSQWTPITTPDAHSTYVLTNVGSSLRAAIAVGGTSGSTLVQRDALDDTTRFVLNPAATGYNLTNVSSGRCADVSGGSTSENAGVVDWSCSATAANQQWRGLRNPAGGTSFVNVNSGKCLAPLNAATTAGATLAQVSCSDRAAVRWNVSTG